MAISEGGSREAEISTGFLTAAERYEVGGLREKAMEIKESGINEVEEKPLTFKQQIQNFIADKFPAKKQ